MADLTHEERGLPPGEYHWEGIVKVQWPIMHSPGLAPECMIYSENRFVMAMVPAEPSIRKAMNGEAKNFLHAVINDEGKLLLGYIAPWQEW